MSIWDKYKINDLPEEQRAEVIKIVAKELEETQRAKLNSGNYQTVRGMAIVALALTVSFVGYYWQDSWKEVKLKSLTPMVCPPPPPGPLPTWDIKISPISDAGK